MKKAEGKLITTTMNNRENKLTDMRIVTNTYLDKVGGKHEAIDQIKFELLEVLKAVDNDLLGKPVKTENDLVKLVQIIGLQQRYTEEEGALYLGICLLAWDEIKLEAAINVVENCTVVKPWKPA